MGGALLQLHAQGAQDVFLTGNPQMTYFKSVYRRHTNFAMETRKLNKQKRGNKEIVRLDKLGDLVYKMYIEIIIPPDENTDDNYYFNPGTSFLKKIELKIGEQLIDSHSKKWIETYYSLTEKNNQGLFGYHLDDNGNIDNYTTKFQELSGSGNYYTNIFTNGKKFIIPLTFWFCKNSGCALPIGALRNHEAKLEIETSDNYNNYPDNTDFHVYADYIYLDKDESRRFKQVSHDYLIEQVQEVVKDDVVQSSFKDYSINFYHPVKEIIWTCTQDIEEFQSTNPDTDKSDDEGEGQGDKPGEEPGDKFKFDGKLTIKINGVEIISEMDSTYYTRKQIYDNHTGPGGLYATIDMISLNPDISCFNDSICVYSFALYPEDYQPSGTCNFSRANQLNIEYRDLSDLSFTPSGAISKRTNPELTFFAVNYNLLRIQDGLCGLVYR